MNAQATNVPAVREPHSLREVAIADHGLGAHLVPQSMADVVRFAETMARGAIAIRKHLRDNPGACLAVTLQALDWGMNPISVANKSYAVNDQLAYESQLIAAVIHSRAPIKGRPRYIYEGDAGTTRTCMVEVTTLDGEVLSYTSPKVGKITTKNSPLWKSDEDQQLGYFSIRSLARRHFPELLLGVYDREEVQDIPQRGAPPPTRTDVRARLEARQAPAEEGFTSSFTPPPEDIGEAEFVERAEAAEEIVAELAHDADTGDILEQDLPGHDDEPEDEGFPGDRRTAPEFNVQAWARNIIADETRLNTVAEIEDFFADVEATRRFRALEAGAPALAGSLVAALNGRKKAAASRAQG